jgi:uncharacterized RDD family membrane protein YckC
VKGPPPRGDHAPSDSPRSVDGLSGVESTEDAAGGAQPVRGGDAEPSSGARGSNIAGPRVVRVGLLRRSAATAVDAVIVAVVWFVAIWLFLVLLTLAGALDPATLQSPSLGPLTLTDQQYALALFAAVMLLVLRGAYLVYAGAALGATPGQQLVHLAITDARTGGRLPAGRAAVRWFVSELPGLGLLLGVGMLLWYGAVALSIARNASGRGFHDLAAGSVVVWRPDGLTREGGTHG